MTKSNQFYTKFNPPPSPSVKNDKPSMVQPQFGYETNINNIVKTVVDKEGRQRAVYTGVSSSLPSSQSQPIYGDFTMLTPEGYAESLRIISDARSKFEQLPSHIRERFANNPQKLLEFVSDPKNQDEAVKLGLAVAKVTAEDTVVTTPVAPTPSVVTSESTDVT